MEMVSFAAPGGEGRAAEGAHRGPRLRRSGDLVGAVKGLTFMDGAPSPEPVDIRRRVTDTFTVLAVKARANSIEVSVQLAADLPRAHAVGAELNQVWMNLIDNALDAVAVGALSR